jgi:D-glycero-D-manno-heptose 1,7-bisphosphate phosphatase
MIWKAASDLDIDIGRSLLVGDKLSDVRAGYNAGIPRNFLLSGKETSGDISCRRVTGFGDLRNEIDDFLQQ